MNEYVCGRTARWGGAFALAFASLGAGFAPTASALDLKPSDIRGEPTQSRPMSVLQKRYFRKTMRPEVGLIAGKVLNEAYTSTAEFGLRGSLFFSEWWGAELQYVKTSVSDTADRQALNKLNYRPLNSSQDNIIVHPDPEVNPVSSFTDLNIIAAPFYGKMNLMDYMIVYSDLYLTGGLSRVSTQQGAKTALSIGAGERFYLFNAWSLRVDFRDRIYNEERAGTTSRKNGLSIDFGASYFFL